MQTMFKDGSVMICGFLGKDAEYKIVGDKNSSLTKFGVMVGEKQVEGQDKPDAIWVNCDCWHDVARATKDLKKFDVVMCVGKIATNEKDGKTYKTLVCDAVFIMNKVPQAAASVATPAELPKDFEEILTDDGCPF